MAYSMNWEARVLTIPRSDLIYLSPNRYKLDLDEFRRKCRALEADPSEGLSYPPVIQYYPAVDTGDVILGRVVLIINGYELELEDTVERYSAITNGIPTPNNSAGLQDLSTLLASAYQGRVVVDVINGQSGQSTPIGTFGKPSNNIPDAVMIASRLGLGEIYIIGNLTLGEGDDVSNLKIIGSAPTLSFINVLTESVTLKTQFERCTLAGVLDGYSTLENSVLWDMAYFSGTMHNIAITDSTIYLNGGASAVLLHCYAATAGNGAPVIDMGGSGQSLTMGNYNGDVKIVNKTGTDDVAIYLNSGRVIVDSTVTSGIIEVYGGEVTDNSTGECVVNHYRSATRQDVYNASMI